MGGTLNQNKMSAALTFLAIYATIGVLWLIVSVFTMVDQFKSATEILVGGTLNFVFWPLVLLLYLAKKS